MNKIILVIFLCFAGFTNVNAQCFANATSFSGPCDTICNGIILIQFGGGQPPYAVEINGGSPVTVTSAFQMGGFCPGVYQFIAIDAAGDTCTGMNVVTVLPNNTPTVTVNVMNATCMGCPDGAATVNVTGGTPPYTYLWSTGTTGSFVGNLIPGIYTVTVADANGCVAQEPFIVGVGGSGAFTLGGEVYFDLNSNGVKDVGELGLQNQVIQIQPPGISSFTNANGEHLTIVIPGTYDVTILPSFGWGITSTPITYNVTVTTTSIGGLDFGLYPDSTAASATINLWSGIPRCQWDVPHYLYVYNDGFTHLDGTLIFTFDPLQTYVSSTIPPASVVGNDITFNFTGLAPGSTFYPHVTLLEPAAGNIVTTSMILSASDQFGGVINDTVVRIQTITCSWDPNDKDVQPAGVGPLNYVAMDSWLSYHIRFQNTGNDTAFKVIILDTLDLNLDISTFSVLGHSHPMVTNIDPSRVVSFTFDNILLPDSNVNEPASNGFVTYRIKGLSANLDPTTVNNTAYIYFDLNPPVQTNTTLTTFSDNWLGISQSASGGAGLVDVFPNPMNQSATIRLKSEVAGVYEVALLDITGRKVQDVGKLSGENNLILQKMDLSSGTYLLRISGDGISYMRIVIR